MLQLDPDQLSVYPSLNMGCFIPRWSTLALSVLLITVTFTRGAPVGISSLSGSVSGYERIKFISAYNVVVQWPFWNGADPPGGLYSLYNESEDYSALVSWLNARLGEGYQQMGPLTFLWSRTGVAQPFTTGPNPAALDAVQVSFANASTAVADRAMFLFDNNGQMLRRLTLSGSSYVPESPIVLNAKTSYWLATEVSASSKFGTEFSLAYHTNSTSFQASGGWTLGTFRTFRKAWPPPMSGPSAFVEGSPEPSVWPGPSVPGGWNPSTGSLGNGSLLVAINGTEVLLPDIGVEFPAGVEITNNQAPLAFPSTIIGQLSEERVYAITNMGRADLLGVSFAEHGPHSADFIVSAPLTNALPPGAVTTFSVTFAPQAEGTRNASLHISSNDPDENPFVLNFEGVGVLPPPDIAVQQPLGTDVPNDAPAFTFQDTLACVCQGVLAPTNGVSSVNYTILNAGTGSLDIASIDLSNTNAGDFELAWTNGSFPFRLAANQTAQFTVAFKPQAGGNKVAQVRIASNDPDENPFVINLTGFAIGTDVDSDQDGLNDAAEFCMSPLGFDWKVKQINLVENLFSNARLAGLYSSNAVVTNPAVFGLYSEAQYNSSRAAGRADVIESPASFGLYTSNSILDLRLDGFLMQRQGSNAVVTFQPQMTTDLATQPFTNSGTPVTNIIPMPGNKSFIRIQAKPGLIP
jgi:hypothetical protein